VSNDVNAVAPAPSLLAGDVGFSGTAPSPTLSATLSWPGDGITITVEATAPAPELTASVIAGIVASFTATAPAPTLVTTGTSPAIITFRGTAPRPAFSASALTGVVITFTGEAPAPELSATAHPAVTITFAGTAPSPELYAQVAAAIAATYRTWVLNTRNNALTEYTGWSFNSFTTFNGYVLAAGPAGLVTLGTQDDDAGTDIATQVRTGKDGFESGFMKRVPRIYVTGDQAGDVQFSVITTEGGTRTYQLSDNSNTGVQTRRVPIGKGIKGVTWQFDMQNVAGCDFGIKSIGVYPTRLHRRVQ